MGIPFTISQPHVFDDYFDDGMKLVDISQDAALRSCLSDGKTADKTKAAYDGCYGQDYDYGDLAGGDHEDNGVCFYKKMGWVSKENVIDEAAIAADMEGLKNQIQKGYLSDVGTCIAWSGKFGESRKREAGMEVQGETRNTQDRELMYTGGRNGMRRGDRAKKKKEKERNENKPKERKTKKKYYQSLPEAV